MYAIYISKTKIQLSCKSNVNKAKIAMRQYKRQNNTISILIDGDYKAINDGLLVINEIINGKYYNLIRDAIISHHLKTVFKTFCARSLTQFKKMIVKPNTDVKLTEQLQTIFGK